MFGVVPFNKLQNSIYLLLDELCCFVSIEKDNFSAGDEVRRLVGFSPRCGRNCCWPPLVNSLLIAWLKVGSSFSGQVVVTYCS